MITFDAPDTGAIAGDVSSGSSMDGRTGGGTKDLADKQSMAAVVAQYYNNIRVSQGQMCRGSGRERNREERRKDG